MPKWWFQKDNSSTQERKYHLPQQVRDEVRTVAKSPAGNGWRASSLEGVLSWLLASHKGLALPSFPSLGCNQVHRCLQSLALCCILPPHQYWPCFTGLSIFCEHLLQQPEKLPFWSCETQSGMLFYLTTSATATYLGEFVEDVGLCRRYLLVKGNQMLHQLWE